jgi:hypothetical protein
MKSKQLVMLQKRNSTIQIKNRVENIINRWNQAE